jgi:hypothetical protein
VAVCLPLRLLLTFYCFNLRPLADSLHPLDAHLFSTSNSTPLIFVLFHISRQGQFCRSQSILVLSCYSIASFGSSQGYPFIPASSSWSRHRLTFKAVLDSLSKSLSAHVQSYRLSGSSKPISTPNIMLFIINWVCYFLLCIRISLASAIALHKIASLNHNSVSCGLYLQDVFSENGGQDRMSGLRRSRVSRAIQWRFRSR